MTSLVDKDFYNSLSQRYLKNSKSLKDEKDLIPLGDSQIESLSEHEKDLLQYAHNREFQMTKFKMNHFVGDAQVTPFAKLKQLIIELRVRDEGLINLNFDRRKVQTECKILEKKINEETDELEKELLQIELERKQRVLQISKQRFEDISKERKQFFELIEEFNNSPEAYLPDGRKIIDVMSDTKEEEILEEQLWTARLAKQAAIDMATGGRIGLGNMEAISNLDREKQTEVLYLASDYGNRLESAIGFLRNESATRLNLEFQDNAKLTDVLKFNSVETKNLLTHREK
jgi:hypothetical protein